MRAALYILSILIVLAAGVVGWRGSEWSHAPLRVFDDMASQPRGNIQSDATYKLPPGSIPGGLAGELSGGKMPENIGFSSRGGPYYETGVWDGYYGQGLPLEVKPKDKEEAMAWLGRGREQFSAHCAVCHGDSGNGKGVAAEYQGFPVLVDMADEMYDRPKYPDGRIFFLITHGLGNMEAYGALIPVRDRWAVVSYMRVLQKVRNSKLQQTGK